jgi:hypothetical protein
MAAAEARQSAWWTPYARRVGSIGGIILAIFTDLSRALFESIN